MSLEGVLDDFPVSDVFQLVAQQRKTGVLQLENGGRGLEVAFVEGDVLRAYPREARPHAALASFLLRSGVVSEPALAKARRDQDETLEPLPRLLIDQGILTSEGLQEVSRLVTHETIFELFLWDQGRFEFRPGDVELTEWDERIRAERFLLDALRMRDEWTSISRGLPDLTAVVVRNADYDAFRAAREELASSSAVRPEELDKIFDLVNDRISARRVIDLSRLGTFGGVRVLVALRRAGLLRVEAPQAKPTRAPKTARSSLRPLLGTATWLGAAGLAFVLNTWQPVPRADFEIPVSALGEARQAAWAERLRTALEAYRWLRGEYPSTLHELSATTSPLLAGVPLDRYSYSREGRSYVLGTRRP